VTTRREIRNADLGRERPKFVLDEGTVLSLMFSKPSIDQTSRRLECPWLPELNSRAVRSTRDNAALEFGNSGSSLKSCGPRL
jgi:hypothetical protein